ncbi:MAG: hypothetical protein P8I35_03700 [Flavobacteriaceae bacterium]|nr:hypothetical protein [Flavobacteriaceae bacterium]
MEKKLRDITVEKIGFKIKSLKDSKRLSQIIAKENDIDISYNTIRRFFGIVKNVQASNFTLDTLSKFNGFDNYSDFMVNFKLKNKWSEEFEISKIIHKSMDDQLLKYIEGNLSHTRSFNLKLIQIIRELLLIGNFNLIRRIFELKKMNANNFNYDDKVLMGMSIGYLVSVVNVKNKMFNKLILNENFQDLIITIFVDYGSLRTYYSDIIKIIHKKGSRKDVRVFCEGILNLNMYLNKEKSESFYILKEENDFHPILKSRIFSQYLLMEDSKIIMKLKDYYQKNLVNGLIPIECLFEINFTTILTRNFEVMEWIIKKIKPDTDYTFFYKYEHYNNFLFMKLIYYTKINDHEKIATIDKNLIIKRFQSYEEMALLYHNICKYKWDKNKKHLEEYLTIAKQVNPKFFTKKYFLNYFN